MALQLSDEGEKVALLALLDCRTSFPDLHRGLRYRVGRASYFHQRRSIDPCDTTPSTLNRSPGLEIACVALSRKQANAEDPKYVQGAYARLEDVRTRDLLRNHYLLRATG